MNSCLFCRIISGEVPSTKLYEDDRVVVIRDLNPKAPVHVLVLPRTHLASLNEANDVPLLGRLLDAARRVAREQGIASTGYKVVINCGEHAGQVIDHLHLHVLGGAHLRGIL